jgi:TetR/AcrR family transcriptional repressor of nem operon
MRYSFRMMAFMRMSRKTRFELKQDSLGRILDAGAKCLREAGIEGSAIIPIMRQAGLTHSAFYSHFSSKDELTTASFTHAITSRRSSWIGDAEDVSWSERLKRLARRYLSRSHRDDLTNSCAFSALSSEAARASPAFRDTYERELRKTLAIICEPFNVKDALTEHVDHAIVLMALCVGGLSLARPIGHGELSDRILRACRNGAIAAADTLDAPRGGRCEQ